MPRIIFSELSTALKYSISLSKARRSSRILSRSRLVSRSSLMSRIALAWISSKPNLSISLSLASAPFLELLMMEITSSRLARAISKPAKICSRSSAFLSSYLVRLVMTSSLCMM